MLPRTSDRFWRRRPDRLLHVAQLRRALRRVLLLRRLRQVAASGGERAAGAGKGQLVRERVGVFLHAHARGEHEFGALVLSREARDVVVQLRNLAVDGEGFLGAVDGRFVQREAVLPQRRRLLFELGFLRDDAQRHLVVFQHEQRLPDRNGVAFVHQPPRHLPAHDGVEKDRPQRLHVCIRRDELLERAVGYARDGETVGAHAQLAPARAAEHRHSHEHRHAHHAQRDGGVPAPRRPLWPLAVQPLPCRDGTREDRAAGARGRAVGARGGSGGENRSAVGGGRRKRGRH